MPRRTVVDPRFPARLRELREIAGLSVRALTARAYVSRSYISELELGRKAPTVDIARRLDDALHAGGELAGLVTLATPDGMTGDDADRLAYTASRPRALDAATIDVLATLLAGQRRLEDAVGTLPVLPVAMTQLDLVARMVREARGPLRPRLVDVAGQWAQFAGWLHLAAGDDERAAALLDRAMEWAIEAGDDELVATVLSFKGHAAWLAHQVGPLIGLTEAALRDPTVYVGQRAYDWYQLARGHAAAGDTRPAMDALATGVDLAAEAAEFTGPAAPWHYYRTPAFFTLEAGLVHRLLGRDDRHHAERAVRLLTDGLADLPGDQAGAEWAAAYAGELVAAHLSVSDAAAAEVVLRRVRAAAEATGSVRLHAQVGALSAAVSADT